MSFNPYFFSYLLRTEGFRHFDAALGLLTTQLAGSDGPLFLDRKKEEYEKFVKNIYQKFGSPHL